MGITNLWPEFKDFMEEGNLSDFDGKKVGVDMYVWFHLCTNGCLDVAKLVTYFTEPESVDDDGDAQKLPPASELLVLNRDQFVKNIVSRVEDLQKFGVIPVCVFDGDEVPLKRNTHSTRSDTRRRSYEKQMAELEKLHKDEPQAFAEKLRRAAAPYTRHYPAQRRVTATAAATTSTEDADPYKKAVRGLCQLLHIDTNAVHRLLCALQGKSVECLVAPYEADPQLAYLCRIGYIAAALSVDSDLIAYYCPCLIKDYRTDIDMLNGSCKVLRPIECASRVFARLSGGRAAASVRAVRASGATNADAAARRTGFRQSFYRALYGTDKVPPTFALVTEAEAAAADGNAAAQDTYSYEAFLLGCIMSGCDYVKNLRGFAIKKAFVPAGAAGSFADVFTILERDFRFDKEELATYRVEVLNACYGFAHHLVYCPEKGALVPFRPLPELPADVPKNGTCTVALKTELVGEQHNAVLAQQFSRQCSHDPRTLQLYSAH